MSRGYWVTNTGRLITTDTEPSRWEKFWRAVVLDWFWEKTR